MGTRIQLSLYVPEPAASVLEPVRRMLDPVQARLIPAHVTLCREDELAPIRDSALLPRLADLPLGPLTLHFGGPAPFHGHGILLPCSAGEDAFVALRQHLLGAGPIRRPSPHITLAHPRNPKAAGNGLAAAAMLPGTMAVTFTRIHLIEQTGTRPWRVLGVFDITGRAAAGRA